MIQLCSLAVVIILFASTSTQQISDLPSRLIALPNVPHPQPPGAFNAPTINITPGSHNPRLPIPAAAPQPSISQASGVDVAAVLSIPPAASPRPGLASASAVQQNATPVILAAAELFNPKSIQIQGFQVLNRRMARQAVFEDYRDYVDDDVDDDMVSEHLLPVRVVELPTSKVPDLSAVRVFDLEASGESSGDGEIMKKSNSIEFTTKASTVPLEITLTTEAGYVHAVEKLDLIGKDHSMKKTSNQDLSYTKSTSISPANHELDDVTWWTKLWLSNAQATSIATKIKSMDTLVENEARSMQHSNLRPGLESNHKSFKSNVEEPEMVVVKIVLQETSTNDSVGDSVSEDLELAGIEQEGDEDEELEMLHVAEEARDNLIKESFNPNFNDVEFKPNLTRFDDLITNVNKETTTTISRQENISPPKPRARHPSLDSPIAFILVPGERIGRFFEANAGLIVGSMIAIPAVVILLYFIHRRRRRGYTGSMYLSPTSRHLLKKKSGYASPAVTVCSQINEKPYSPSCSVTPPKPPPLPVQKKI